MTDETKGDGMTLEQVRDEMYGVENTSDIRGATFDKWRNSIDANLAAQSAMRVDEAPLCIGQNVLWEDNFGRLREAQIINSHPATYDAILADGVRADGYVRRRFRTTGIEKE